MSERRLDRIPEMSERRLDRIPERMTKKMSEWMPEINNVKIMCHGGERSRESMSFNQHQTAQVTIRFPDQGRAYFPWGHGNWKC